MFIQKLVLVVIATILFFGSQVLLPVGEADANHDCCPCAWERFCGYLDCDCPGSGGCTLWCAKPGSGFETVSATYPSEGGDIGNIPFAVLSDSHEKSLSNIRQSHAPKNLDLRLIHDAEFESEFLCPHAEENSLQENTLGSKVKAKKKK